MVSSQVAHTDQSWVLLPWASTVQRTMGPLAAHHTGTRPPTPTENYHHSSSKPIFNGIRRQSLTRQT